MHFKKILFFIAIIPALLNTALADFSETMPRQQLNVLADYGGESIISFYDAIAPSRYDDAKSPYTKDTYKPTLEDYFPLLSPNWTFGYVGVRKSDFPPVEPFFIIGGDKKSLSWLKANRERLSALNALGLMMNIPNEEALFAARAIVPTLSIMPYQDKANLLQQRLQLNHYPVLILPDFIGSNLDELREVIKP